MATDIPNRGPALLGVDAAFMSAAILANLLRCYVRIRMVKAFGVDDWLMAIATITFAIYCSFSIAGVHYGTGRHHRDLPNENIHKAMNYWWYCYLFYSVTMITSKLSIGWFLLRIAVKKIHSWIIYASMFISVIAGTVFFLVTLFQCKPIPYFWNKDISGRCINPDVVAGLAYLYSAFSIVSDFTFAIIPAFLVWNLQLNRRTKIALIPLLTMGCIASSAVVARVPYLHEISNPDFLWATLDVAIWSTVEQGLAIVAGSLATLRPLFKIITHKLGLTTGPTSNARPSKYGRTSPSASQTLSSRRKHGQETLKDYKLSHITEVGASDDTLQIELGARDNDTTNLVETNDKKSKRETFGGGRKKTLKDNESEKSLKSPSSKTSLEQDAMQIMVSKSFYVTDESN